MWKENLISAMAGGFTSRLLTHPIDTAKVRIQSGQISSSFASTLKSLLLEEPIRNWYKGFWMSAALSVPALTLYLTVYEETKEALKKAGASSTMIMTGYGKDFIHLSSAFSAEVISGLVWTPLEVMKQRKQVENVLFSAGKPAASPNNKCINEGMRQLYRGYLMSLFVYVPHTMIYFGLFERFKDYFAARGKEGGQGLLLGELMISSFCSGVVSSAISGPLDTIKTAWQLQSLKPQEFLKQPQEFLKQPQEFLKQPQEFVNFVNLLVRTKPFRFWLDGSIARVVWMAPSITISITTYEYLRKSLFRDS